MTSLLMGVPLGNAMAADPDDSAGGKRSAKEHEEAAELMEEHGVSCLPVVTGTSLVGIITREGLASLSGGPDAHAAAEVCVACGSTEKVHRDPRAGMLADQLRRGTSSRRRASRR